MVVLVIRCIMILEMVVVVIFSSIGAGNGDA